MKKRRLPLPDPPPLRGVVFDGSNVIAASGARADALARVELAAAWFRERCPDWRQMVFLDAATARRLRPEVQDVVRARCEDVTPEHARWAVCPPDEEADEHVLEYARAQRALVVSNDRFFDHEELRLGAVTLQFSFRVGEFVPHEEATWFRPSGGAQRVTLAALLA